MVEERSPARKVVASSWWERLATITVEHSQPVKKKRRSWTMMLRQLIRTKR